MVKIAAQFAMFLDNRPGTLARACQALAAAHINIVGLSMLDTVDHAIVRIVVDQPKEAERVLSRLQIAVQKRDVLVVDLPNEAGALATVAQRLTEAGINIEYAYCTVSASQRQGGSLILRTNDLEATINALS